jgi:hypothetical protein
MLLASSGYLCGRIVGLVSSMEVYLELAAATCADAVLSA